MHFSSLVVFLFLALGYVSSALAEDGLVNRHMGGQVSEMVSSHGHTYLAQGSTLVTVNWDESGIPAVADISPPVKGFIRHLAIDGDSLWASATWEFERGRLLEYSLQEPASPKLVREWRLENGVHPEWGLLKRVDDLLYVGRHDGTLSAYRFAESGVLEPIFDWALPPAGSNARAESFKALETWEDEVLLAVVGRESSFQDLYMLDVSDPGNPQKVSGFAARQTVAHARHGDEIALVGHYGIYQVIDWSDLANPRQIHLQTGGPGAAYGFGARFDSEYLVANSVIELTVYDATDITALEQVASVPVIGLTDKVAVGPKGAPLSNLMTFVTRNAELLTLDLSDPRDPQLQQVLDLPPGFNVRRVRETEDMLVAVTEGGLTGLSENLRPEWRYPASPDANDRYSDVVIGDQWIGLSTVSADSFILRPDPLEGFEQIARSAPYTDRLTWDGEILWSFGLRSYNDTKLHEMSDPGNPQAVSINTHRFSHVRDTARKGDIVYVADVIHGIAVARMTSSGLELVTPIFLPECKATSLDIQADLLVAACREDGPALYDLSVPEAPLLLTRIDLGASNEGWDVLLDDGLLWYSHSRGAALLDVSNPLRPLLIEQTAKLSAFEYNWSSWQRDTGRLARSNRGGVWVAADVLGLLELNGVSPIGPEWTGAWYDPSQVGQGLMLEVLAANGALVTWFDYDARGHQRWLQGVGQINNNRIDIPEVYRMKGPSFAAPGASIEIDVVGSARLSFHDCNTGVVELEAGGERRLSYIEPLARTMTTGCRLSEDSIETTQSTQSGLWFDPQLPGQGISLILLDTGGALMNWFTYDADGNQLWIQGVGEPANDELLFSNLYTTLATRHGVQYDPGMFRILPWGEAVLALGCDEGSLEWNSSHGSFDSGQMSLRRLTMPLGLEC